jgi:hypothetical protein
MFKEFAGYLFILWGILDAIKYHLQASRIRKVKTAKEHSRMFLNMAIGNDLYRFIYFLFINRDYYVLFTALLAIIFMLEYWWEIYSHYPYRCRKLNNFKKPNITLYVINSILPNRIRRRL